MSPFIPRRACLITARCVCPRAYVCVHATAELHARMEEQRRKLAEASLARLDRLAQERLEASRSELEAVREDIVARSKQRQAEVCTPVACGGTQHFHAEPAAPPVRTHV